MITYGKCLLTTMDKKKKLSPIFRKIFLKENLYGFEELLKLDEKSWDFFIKSINFLKSFLYKYQLDKNNKYYLDIYLILKKNLEKDFVEWESVDYLQCLYDFANEIKAKAVKHYYIETKPLYEFLTSIKIRKLDDIIEYIKTLDNKVIFAFHLPENESFAIKLQLKNDKLDAIIELKKEFYRMPMQNNQKMIDYINNNDALKLCFNVMSYTECFKENVIEGVPRDCKDKPLKSEITKTLTPIKEIENFTKKEIAAHFRHSHFRFCGSDYFKDKKGKWIFVKGSMVNSTAKTIIKE